ncbi:agmatine deiminase family protein [Vibrio sp. S4M6]|uniref:agmatine deiminase family protein n=1 Tax=Vibrio sinus TaxID=2946865 RepID=UPI002029DC04|nr:agmatine deiminase family protein [Vibrio sinus]MCL9781711.1 agmatine deiminase family protein [Vibrio sinus]
MKKYLMLTAMALTLAFSKSSMAELIVLASPPDSSGYYHQHVDDIVDFQINYAKHILDNDDDVLILTANEFYKTYVKALGKDHVLVFPMDDIWMRDFTLTNPGGTPIAFRYTAEGQAGNPHPQEVADEVQDTFFQLVEDADLHYKETDLLNDGGNVVDDYAGNVIMSTKFLRDNHLNEDQARTKLKALMGAKHIAFIEADELGGLEHADGVASFVDENTVVVNDYPTDQAYTKELKDELKRQLPGVHVVAIAAPYDANSTVDPKFPSACGLYTNMLVTPDSIYFPQFGIPEDKIAIKQLQAVTDKKIVPVSSQSICGMGGGVRCMSLQLRGENAQRLMHYVRSENH